MTWNPTISSGRRQAIGRASQVVVRLAVDPEAKKPATRQHAIVNDYAAFTDREAWEVVAALELMVGSRGLTVPRQI